MGKPSPSFQNLSIGTLIAQAAVTSTSNRLDLVARSGQCSIFQVVKAVYPSCARLDSTSRDGITECHLNKSLEKAGYERVRDRRVHVSKRAEDPIGAGMYFFGHLRIRNPNRDEDRQEMIEAWNSIIDRFPNIAKHCTLSRFMQVVSDLYKQWQPYAERMNRASIFDVEPETASENCESARQSPLQANSTAGPKDQTQLFDLNNRILQLQLDLAKAQTLLLLQTQQAKTASIASSVPVTPGRLLDTSNPALSPHTVCGPTLNLGKTFMQAAADLFPQTGGTPAAAINTVSPLLQLSNAASKPRAMTASDALALLLSNQCSVPKPQVDQDAKMLDLACPGFDLNVLPSVMSNSL